MQLNGLILYFWYGYRFLLLLQNTIKPTCALLNNLRFLNFIGSKFMFGKIISLYNISILLSSQITSFSIWLLPSLFFSCTNALLTCCQFFCTICSFFLLRTFNITCTNLMIFSRVWIERTRIFYTFINITWMNRCFVVSK